MLFICELVVFLVPLVAAGTSMVASELEQTLPTKDGLLNLTAVFSPRERMRLDFINTVLYDQTQNIQVNGATEDFVTTEDGYILRVFRMTPLPKCEGKSKGPLIWWHGLFLGANCCIILGEGCQCYKYLQACYEVYVPNSRGNRYSRNHTTLNPDRDPAFWAFGLEELAMYDVPAVVDYVLNRTGASKVAYVSHSQGITILVLCCALKPQYNAKISLAFGQSPTFWLQHSTTPLLDVEAAVAPGLTFATSLGYNGELFAYGGVLSKAAMFFCTQSTLTYPPCLSFVYLLFNYNGVEISETALRDTVSKEPSGISVELFRQWGIIKIKGFKDKNGNDWPLDKVTLKLRLVGSPNDNVASLEDVETFLKHIPNSPYEVCVLSDKLFGHLDHISGVHSPLYDADWVLGYLGSGTSKGCVGRTVVAPDTALVSK